MVNRKIKKMAKIILILGGVRSGKSNFALSRAKKGSGKTTFIATCLLKDKEMKERIVRHRLLRPKNWETLEEGYNLEKALGKTSSDAKNIIVDCLGVYIGNLMHVKMSEEKIINNIEGFIKTAVKLKNKTIFIVSNEVGSGLVPPSRLGRIFRDVLGTSNQMVAKRAKEVYLLVAGIPVKIK